MGKTNFNKNKKQMQAQTLINLMNQLTSNATLSAIPRNMPPTDDKVHGCALKTFNPCMHLAKDHSMPEFLKCADKVVTPDTPCHKLTKAVREHYEKTGETPF